MTTRKKSIPDQFLEIKESKDKVAKLKELQTPALMTYLAVSFDPKWEWDLPSGTPPLKGDRTLEYGMTGTNMINEARRMYVFGKQYQSVRKNKKEALWINLLEGLHQTEIELLEAIKDGNVTKLFGLTEDHVREAFPGYLSPAIVAKTKKSSKKSNT